MPGFDRHRLALVACTVKTREGALRDCVGTGYFVTAELILTAAHVIPDDVVDIKVRLEANGQWQDVEVVPTWTDRQLDAVLLRVSEPLIGLPEIEWYEDSAPDNVKWTSTAYPVAAQQERAQRTEWKTLGLQGTLYPHGGRGQGSADLDLSVEAPPSEVEGWSGISGAPVFVGDKLAGIIKSVPDELGGRRLAGTASTLLAQNAGFRMALAPKWLDDLPKKPWILVLLSEDEQNDLKETITGTIKRHYDSLTLAAGTPIHHEPFVVNITDALQSPGHWLKLVRAACTAPIMLVDVTGFQPGVLLALGVRAVVRRGVTITSTAKALDETELSQLPFNIQETKLICHGGSFDISERKHPLNLLGKAICDGLRELRSHSRYLDLPAYDAVRCPVPDAVTGVPGARDSIVVLCPFSQTYEPNWRWISGKLASRYPNDLVVRMVDIASPRLIGQSLYEHIRWATTCVVDWTDWRPNVFFEFGVRVASSEIAAICLIEHAALNSANTLKQLRQLIDLFKPTSYSAKGDPEQLRIAFRAHDRIKEGLAPPALRPVLPHDATYKISTVAFDWEQEGITLKPHDMLRTTAEIQLGKDPQKQGVSPVLFSENFDFSRQLRRSVQERWIAAWYYFRNRHPLEAFRTDETLRNELMRLGEAALMWLPKSGDAQIEKLRDEIINLLEELESPID